MKSSSIRNLNLIRVLNEMEIAKMFSIYKRFISIFFLEIEAKRISTKKGIYLTTHRQNEIKKFKIKSNYLRFSSFPNAKRRRFK